MALKPRGKNKGVVMWNASVKAPVTLIRGRISLVFLRN